MTRNYGQACPIARTLDLIGERWTILILRDLFLGATRFSEFREHSPGIPTKLLADRLKWLEQHGIVARQVYREHPLRAGYHLTEYGRTLEPIINSLYGWGIEHVIPKPQRRAIRKRVEARLAGDTALGKQ